MRHADPLQIAIRFARPCLDDMLLAAMLGIDLGSLILEGKLRSFDDLRFEA